MCVNETRSGISLMYFLLFGFLGFIGYRALHPIVIDLIEGFNRRKNKGNRCSGCGSKHRVGKIFCHRCGKKNNFEKEEVDLTHIFEK